MMSSALTDVALGGDNLSDRVQSVSINARAEPGFWKGGATEEDVEMSGRSRQGDAEGVAGAECDGCKAPMSMEGLGAPRENFQNFGAFAWSLGIPQPDFQTYKHRIFLLLWKKKLQINELKFQSLYT